MIRSATTQAVALGDFGWFADATNTEQMIVLPLPLLTAITATGPLLWLLLYRRRQRLLIGHCTQCGYDLRASGNRCPECGMISKDVQIGATKNTDAS